MGTYQVRWSNYAQRWWAGEQVGNDMAEVRYYLTYVEALNDIIERMRVDNRLAGATEANS